MNLMKYVRVQWDRAGAVIAAVVGVIALIFGYLGTSDTEYIAEQIPFIISGGLAAIVLFTVAGVLWLSADLRDEWRELAAQGEDLRAFMTSETAGMGKQSGNQSGKRDG
ncbi:hypothetical protein [Sporichthya sp.]|uniref:hypothetical protein n=1 Tax=Sporichthya sp. TaxID=65475 RepID=UPI0017BF9ABC|nr:hypothetical protein [Sporichthya sp.]MBA3744183.1 hypothetical protein [Sporichthya sp.]